MLMFVACELQIRSNKESFTILGNEISIMKIILYLNAHKQLKNKYL